MKGKTKVIKDLVHEYVTLDEECQKIIDTPSFQRLKNIKQLTAGYLFPSATHTRFEHSLGVMKLAMDFFYEIEESFEVVCDKITCRKSTEYYRDNLKIAALLHDLGHAPLSHLGEGFYEKDLIKDELKPKCGYRNINFEEIFGKDSKGSPHEIMSCYCILENMAPLLDKNENVDYEFICRIITGNLYKKDGVIKDYWARNIMISIVNSDSIDVDKLDYLMRDNHMCGYPAPHIDVPRLLRSMYIKNKKLCFSSSGIPALQSIIDSRDMLYLWVYNHHIPVYTDYITSDIIRHIIAKEKENGSFEFYKKYFSPAAVSKEFVSDSDIYVMLKDRYLDSVNGREEDDFIKKNIVQLFTRDFLKPTWKTIYEYSDFLEKEIVDENMLTYIKEKLLDNDRRDLRVDIVKKMRTKLGLDSGDLFIITRSNKFYHKGEPSAFNVMIDEQERSLSKLLPQKDYQKFDNISFYIFGPKEKKEILKKTFIDVVKEELGS
ncbi:HD domain-containing protein [Cetobacterium sp. ZOR0034]|uniref:HD domain-containing protein n=1 Tax=Cetobacterium sp. ZOR0034 TaxID=1339239 RepID=UPI000648C5F9|nr:HD domain-containing protein [Cetobacterium sp. ZOR0034]